MQETPLIAQVRALLSGDQFVRLAETLGGERIYVPQRLAVDHVLVDVLGRDTAERLGAAIGGGWLVVPLAKRERALHYEAQGLKDHEIARRVGMTRSGVQRLLDRERQATLSCGPGRSKQTSQLDLFES